MATAVRTKYNVGGIMLDQPFKVRRLGHFGFNVNDIPGNLRFYNELLGFSISDTNDFGPRIQDPVVRASVGDARGFFMHYGGDHHAFVLFPRRAMEAMRPPRTQGVTINQITWQVGSLAEVVHAAGWFPEQGVTVQRSGRDMPGSNWHTYVYDPDGHTNELYYGIEQIGWEGYSKPRAMYDRRFTEVPSLPQASEFQEVQDALARGQDLHEGYRYLEQLPANYDVEGILLPRPFKIVRIGPVRLFVQDVEAARAFYQDKMGFSLTEEVNWRGHRCLFLRVNTEHHALALYPVALRAHLNLSGHTTCMSFGIQLASYKQLRDAAAFLTEHGAHQVEVPPELYPGIDYAAHFQDPDGHCVQLYYYMEQVGWDGRPRPKDLRRTVNGGWPEALEPLSDTYAGEPFLGPWG